ncbi:MAG TPA: NHL repeat-containing protein [Sedimentisphaerales bacterium]|nr:NHL repeat-containing protein [Sedimentisphaerales bacterium]
MYKIRGKANPRLLVGVLIALAVIVAVAAVVRLDVFGRKGNRLGKGFDYDIEELARIDPNLILYEESGGVIETGLAASHAIAVDSKGSIYVAADRAIRKFSDRGVILGEIDLAEEPGCLTVLADGTLYVGLKDHVEIYDAQGQRQGRWESLGPDARLTSIAVSDDNVFVADAGHRVVVRYDASGNLVGHIGKKDSSRNVPGFVIPSPYFDMAVSRDGLLRVVNPGCRRIEAYTFDGDLEFWWGSSSVAIEGFCGCCNPVNIAVLPDGGYVTCEKGLVRVKVYDSEGEFVGVVAGPRQLVRDGELRVCDLPEECQAGGFDVAVDPAGRILVLDTIKNIVRIFTKTEGRQ